MQVTWGSVPLLGASFGTKIEVFKWKCPSKIQALVWIGTRKPETEQETVV